MGLWTLLEGCLLIANALAILNEDRFLAPRGWSFQEYSGVKRNSLKGQIIGLIYATQYLRVLLMILNSLCIVVKLVESGGYPMGSDENGESEGRIKLLKWGRGWMALSFRLHTRSI
ncbi:hypothetical protein L1987_22732 [Smallanthus sonchifolius]|uniref:Uncharacterized protein n=1 Tax=Smallanthus sonchifolius TaxID=185202 RepID=A0ACB9IIC0_9ASTR|nr:hypothetical protein L1987_22732 [Smallanthus sonchifolius]